jgi:DNA-binding NarL/FixJ family response regulator
VALVTLERAVNGQLSSSWTRKSVPQKERRTVSTLTARESEVMGLLVAGRSTEAIASALGVSRSTVHSHVQSVLLKLGARSRIEAVSIYLDGTTALVREHPARPASGY